MSLQAIMILLLTVLASVCIVAVIISLGWFLIWKAFLSKFRLVRELLGHANGDEQPRPENVEIDRQLQAKTRKVRRD